MTAAVLKEIEELSCDWLGSVLGCRVSDWGAEEIVGEGYASRMYRLTLIYRGEDTGPESLILKLATANITQTGMHEVETLFREVNFYAGPGRKLAGVVPKVYFAESDESSMQLTILMEDLGPIPHKPFKETLENSIKAMYAIAKVHASYWNDPMLTDSRYNAIESAVDFDSVVQLAKDSMEIERQAGYSYPYLNACMKHIIKLAKWLIQEGNHLKGAVTLIHGDFHARNIHVGDVHAGDKRVLIYDWQTAERGIPARDVVYWLLTSVDVADQVAFKPKLIDAYLDALEENGISDYGRKQFNQQYMDAVTPLIPRMYCYQALIEVDDSESHLLPDFLDRTEKIAKSIHYLAIVRLMRVIMPVFISVLRLFGKR